MSPGMAACRGHRRDAPLSCGVVDGAEAVVDGVFTVPGFRKVTSLRGDTALKLGK